MTSAADDGIKCIYCKCTEFTEDQNLGSRWAKCRNCGVSQPVECKDISIRGEMLYSHYEKYLGEGLASRFPKIEGADEVAFIRQHIEGPLDMKIIDLGTAAGDFLPSLRELGHDIMGIDKFRPYAAYGEKHALPIHHTSIEELLEEGSANSVDLISIREAIYYVDDLKLFFENVKKLLKPGGHLYIKTGVADSFYYRFMRGDAHKRVGEFATLMLDPQVLKGILVKEGFSVVAVRKIGLNSNIVVFGYDLARGNAFVRFCGKCINAVFRKLTVITNTADRVCILARI
ncbi:MAG: methyltransferase domain-containing protein [Anaerolineaceae bacterium]|nr:class I SAM-dependent methyltransferase [Betaproteobacteria bacterium]